MNTYEAKRGFITFLILTITVVGMSLFVNNILVTDTASETQASSSIITKLPRLDLIILVGIPIFILGVIITAIKRVRRKTL